MMVAVGGWVALSVWGTASLGEIKQEKQANHDLE